MKKWHFVALLLVGATVLGATVLREPIAWAAQTVDAKIIAPLDASGNMKVHEAGTAQVDVTNASLTVHDADRPTLQPFAGGSNNNAIGILNGSYFATDSFTVPAGKRLVIEHVSTHISVPSGQFPQLVGLTTVADGVSMRHSLTPTPLTTYSGDDWFSLSQPIVMYADPGSTVTILVNRFPANTGIGGVAWAVTGYLVDV